jgi:putative alpha-1,2-mannosidase
MATEYLDSQGGLSGNDDSGQMSAWYVFASLGFYPVCPATPYYILASPSFKKTAIHLENGKIFTIIAHGASDKKIYIRSAKLNGKIYTKNYITHQDILEGGTLEFEMDENFDTLWGSKPEDCPPQVLQ